MRKQKIVNILLIILGNISLALGTSLFILPHNIVNGGISGISVVTSALFGWNAAITILIIDWLLFFIGFVILGKSFALKTLLSTVLYPLLIAVFTLLNITAGISDSLLASLVGAVLSGFGLGICYRAGASTGGFTDCLIRNGAK